MSAAGKLTVKLDHGWLRLPQGLIIDFNGRVWSRSIFFADREDRRRIEDNASIDAGARIIDKVMIARGSIMTGVILVTSSTACSIKVGEPSSQVGKQQ